ncbi:hypothetical protein [Hydrogenophaga sp.]|uniref:hypothetical protein n=1 Tax=Hydrogenophaga sp. TaxID=1904254 RepID=UPI003F6F490D
MAEHEPIDADRQQLLEWLPLAANETLAPDLLAQLESGLARHPDLRHELRWLQTLRHTVQAQPLEAVPDGDLGWSKLERRMAATAGARRNRAATIAPQGWSEKLRDWLQANFGPVLATACVLMVAQAVLIGTLIQQASTFEAAGGKPPVEGVASGVLLHVTVREGVSELQLREALRRFNASIVQGPSALGIYTLRMADGSGSQDARALAQRLIDEAGGVFESAAPTTGE